MFCLNSCLHIFSEKRVVFRISGNDSFFRLSIFFVFPRSFKFPFADLAGNYFASESLKKSSCRAKTLHFAHAHTSELPLFTFSPHDTTLPFPTQPHPTYSSPYPSLVPSTPQSHHPYALPEIFVQPCSKNIPLRAADTAYACWSAEREFPTLALHQ